MPTMCIECALIAIRDGTTPPVFHESPAEHMARVHPAGGLQGADRAKLEQDAMAALQRKDKRDDE